jgi:hypothetical protein
MQSLKLMLTLVSDHIKGALLSTSVESECFTQRHLAGRVSEFFNDTMATHNLTALGAPSDTPSGGEFDGEEFSNNLFTDLALLLTLFGEQVTKQFLSQSLCTANTQFGRCSSLWSKLSRLTKTQ